jgi:sugar phosphate isomerase/epimerase
MNIEEDDPAAALAATGPRLAHVQVNDSNRLQPGTGHLDFGAAFSALRAVGYQGWLALECRLRGDPAQALPATARFLRGLA